MIDSWEELLDQSSDDDGVPTMGEEPRDMKAVIPDTVCICLHSLSGELIGEITKVAKEMSILALKHEIAERWAVPVECQRLLEDAEILSELCEISKYTNGKQALVITLIASLEPLWEFISDSNKSVRRKGIAKLEQFVERGPEATLFSLNVDDPRPLVRREIMLLLERASRKDNTRAKNLLRTFLCHAEDDVRIGATKALVKCCDYECIDSVIHLLHDRAPLVREEALRALPMLIQTAKAETIDVVIDLLEDPEEFVREHAAWALPKLVVCGDRLVVERLVGMLERHGEAGANVLKVLTKVACERDLWDLVIAHVQDVRLNVRTEALFALNALAATGNASGQRALEILQSVRSESTDHDVRHEAIAALINISRYFEEARKISILVELVRSGDPCVLDVLRISQPTGAPCLLYAVIEQAHSEYPEARECVAYLLGNVRLSQYDMELSMETLRSLLEDPICHHAAKHALHMLQTWLNLSPKQQQLSLQR